MTIERFLREEHGSALDAYYANFEAGPGALTLYERAQITDAPWDNSEIEPFDEDCIWTIVDEEHWHIELERRARETDELFKNAAPAQPPTEPVKAYAKKPIHAKLRWAVFRRDGYHCVICGSDEDLTADHIVAEVKGGKATIGNLRTLCRPCNSKKGAR